MAYTTSEFNNDFDEGTLGVTCVADTSTARLQPASTCIPSVPTSEEYQIAVTASVHSPGNICPAGFSTACSLSRTAGDCPYTDRHSKYLWEGLSEGETAIGCCPRGHSCYDIGIGVSCQKTRKGGTATLVSMTNEYDCRSVTTTTKIHGGGRYGGGDIFYDRAPRVILVRQATDPPATHIPHEDDPYYVEPSRGLSKGAIAGIAIGGVIGGLIFLCLAVCCCAGVRQGFQKSKRPQQPQQEGEELTATDPPPSYEAATNQTTTHPSSSELPEDSQALLSRAGERDDGATAELDSRTQHT